jgi:hypothetical protein
MKGIDQGEGGGRGIPPIPKTEISLLRCFRIKAKPGSGWLTSGAKARTNMKASIVAVKAMRLLPSRKPWFSPLPTSPKTGEKRGTQRLKPIILLIFFDTAEAIS